MAVEILLNPFTSEPPSDFTQGLERLRWLATDAGYDTRSSDLQQTMRVGKRLYLLDAGYSSSALHIRLSVRKAGNPRTKVLGVWRPQAVTALAIDLIWNQVNEAVDSNEKKVRG